MRKKAFSALIIVMALTALINKFAFAVTGTTIDPSRTLFSARQLGMGGVSVAFSDDANGIFSNPAGLSNLQFPQLLGTSRKIFLEETQYSLIGWAVPTHWGTFGLGYTGMNISGSVPTYRDSTTNRIVQNPSLEVTSYDNNVIVLSYTKELLLPFKLLQRKISLGGSLKFLNQSLSGGVADKASGTNLDLGLIYQPLSWFTTGVVLQNIFGGTLKWSSTEDQIGSNYKLGMAANILGSSSEAWREFPQNLTLGFDLDLQKNVLSQSSSFLYHLGLEYFPLKNIALRTGINQEVGSSSFTLGVGFINSGFRFDYAFLQRPNLPDDTPHYFSLSYIGDRIVSVHKKLKKKEPSLSLFYPQDRTITSLEVISVSGEVKVKRILDKKTTWAVPSISATHEVQEIDEYETMIQPTLNNYPVTAGTFEVTISLTAGRNVLKLIGYTSPEAKLLSQEVKVLRFSPFLDTPMDYWAIEPIALLVTLGLTKGYPDYTFKPGKGITRAELVALLARTTFVSPEVLTVAEVGIFKDVSASHWAFYFIKQGVLQNLATGYPDATFKPNRVLSRAEGVTVLARYAGLTPTTEIISLFPDLKPNFWANQYLAAAKKAGLLKYLEGKNFEPSKPFSRAEATEVLYRITAIRKMVDQWWETEITSLPQTEIPPAPTPLVTPEVQSAPTQPTTAEVQPIETKSSTPEMQLKKPATIDRQ